MSSHHNGLGVGNSGIGASSSDSSPAACRAALALAAARNSKSMAVARAPESEAGNSPELLPWVLRFTFFRLGFSCTGSILGDLEPCLAVFKVEVVSGNSMPSLFPSSNVHFCFEGFFFTFFFTFFAFFVLESSDVFSNAACFFFLGTRLVSQLFGLRSASSLVNLARKASAMLARLERMAASNDFWQASTWEVERCQHPANPTESDHRISCVMKSSFF